MDVFPDVIAYGILLLPKDIKEGEKRPVVVCQHGLEGRPQRRRRPEGRTTRPINQFAVRLAERGFITFAPQNLYIFEDRFRTLQRKANPLEQDALLDHRAAAPADHRLAQDAALGRPGADRLLRPELRRQVGDAHPAAGEELLPVDLLGRLQRVGLEERLDAAARTATSGRGEYEIFEFDLGSTFNYAEMAALIAPRPFMVERGHFDGVAPDETVAYEFAKVVHLYDARLGMGDRCEIEFFVGPHTINGKGTFAFLHKHLKWPGP